MQNRSIASVNRSARAVARAVGRVKRNGLIILETCRTTNSLSFENQLLKGKKQISFHENGLMIQKGQKTDLYLREQKKEFMHEAIVRCPREKLIL